MSVLITHPRTGTYGNTAHLGMSLEHLNRDGSEQRLQQETPYAEGAEKDGQAPWTRNRVGSTDLLRLARSR
jgi:hypothetical protein